MLEKLKAYLRLNNIPSNNLDDRNDMLIFSIEGLNFVAEYNRNVDDSFFRILLPQVDEYSIDHLELLKRLNSIYKAAKILFINDQIWFSIETLVFGNVNAPELFARMIAILRDMINDYRRSING